MSYAKNMYDVISIGSATLDIFVKSRDFKVIPSSESETGVVLCEAYGAKMEVDELYMLSGGGATNTAVSFYKKGLHAGVIAEMGKDLAADSIISDLQHLGLSTELLVQEQSEQTAVSVILVSPDGGRSIVTHRGASKMLEIKDIPWDQLQTRWTYISSLGGKVDLLEALVWHCWERGIPTAVNPGGGELQQRDWIKNFIPKMTLLLLNMEEAAELLGIPADDETPVLEKVKDLGARITVITNGEKGAYIYTPEKNFKIIPLTTDVVETTGAGDAFGSGLVAGLALGWSIEQSIQLAAVNSASVIQHVGAKRGLVTIEEFNESAKSEVIPL